MSSLRSRPLTGPAVAPARPPVLHQVLPHTLALAVFSLLTLPAAAQTSPAAADAAAESATQQLVVTGTRRSNRTLGESESPVDLISGRELQAAGSTELATVLGQLLPSLNFPRPSLTDASDAVRPAQLRGLSPDQTLVLVNGKRRHTAAVVNINGSQGRGSAAVDLNAIPIASVDHIEVLRDGAAAQYGSDAIAGVINIVLKKGAAGGGVSLEGGQTSEGDGGRFAGAANAGLALGEAGWVRLAVEAGHQARTNRAGVDSRDAATEPRKGQVNNRLGDPDSSQRSLALNAQLELPADVQGYSFATYSERDVTTAAFWRTQATAVANHVDSLYPEGFLPLERSTTTDFGLVAGLRGRLGEWSWDASLNHGRNHFTIDVDHTANYSLGAASPTHFYAGSLSNQQTVGNLDLLREIDLGLFQPATLSLGAEARRERYGIGAGEADSYTGGGASGFPGFQPGNAGWHARHNVAAYAGLEGAVSPELSASAALRVEDYSDFGRATSAKLSGRYVLDPAVALRATVSTGFRAPSLAQQYFSTTSTNLINGALVEAGTFPVDSAAARALGATPLRPEKSRNLSLGVNFQHTPDWQTSLDLYQVDIDHRILLSANLSLPTALRELLASQGVNVSAGRYFTNALDTRTRGLDLVSSLRQNWGGWGRGDYTLAFNYNRNSVQHVDDNPALLSSYNLLLIDRVTLARATVSSPSSKLVLGAEHHIGPWSGRLGVSRYGSYVVRQSSAVNDQTFNPAWLFDLSGGWQAGPWSAGVGVDNLTDRRPEKVLAANSVGGILTYSSFSPYGFNGRQYYAKLGYRW